MRALISVSDKIISLNSQLTIIKEQNASINDEISILQKENLDSLNKH